MILNHPLHMFIALFLLLAASVEVGFRLAVSGGAAEDPERHEQASATRDALGILLSLLLGFTLAMALPRYDARRQLLMEEANAIGTTKLRGELLPEAQRNKVHGLLLEYVDARLAFTRAKVGTDEMNAATNRTRALQAELWENASAAAKQTPNPATALFISTLNDTIRPQRKAHRRPGKPHPDHHLGDAGADFSDDLPDHRPLPPSQILDGHGSDAVDDCHCDGTDRGPGQLEKWINTH